MTSSDADGNLQRSGQWQRRTVLRSLAAGVGLAGTAGAVSGQTGTDEESRASITRGVIPEQQRYDNTVTGFFIHLAGEVDPIEASVSNQCDFVDWDNDATAAYDARLIDRKAEPESQQVTLYLNDATEVGAGDLFIINDREQCESAYLGIELERTGVNLAQLRARDFTPQMGDGGGGGEANADGTDASGASGPGLGVLSGVAGLLGAGWLAGRQRE